MTPADPERPRPFEPTADPTSLFENAPRVAVKARLHGALAGGAALCILTGDPGTGKTALMRRLMADLESAGFRCATWDLPVEQDDLRARLPAAEAGRRVAVGLDEAQAFRPDTLAGIARLLVDRPDVAILLVGQPGLEGNLAALEARGEALPAVVHCRLAALAGLEVGPYMRHRWGTATSGPFPFPPSAIARIADISAGLPQVINLLSSRALRVAETRGSEQVTAELVEEAARDLVRGARRAPRPRRRRAAPLLAVAARCLVAGVAVFLRVGMSDRKTPGAPPPQAQVPKDEPRAAAALAPTPEPRQPLPPIDVDWALAAAPVSPSPMAPVSEPERAAPAVAAITPEAPVVTSPPVPAVVTSPPVSAPRPSERPSSIAPAVRPARETPARPVAASAAAAPASRGADSLPRMTAPLVAPTKGDVLLRRAEDGDLAGVRALLADRVPPDARDGAGFTPLMLAVIHDHPAIVDALLTAGAAVNARNRAGLTPLMLAAINDNGFMARTLVARRAEVNARSGAGWTALTYAAWRGHARMVRLLLTDGADPNVTDSEGWTILQYANWRATEPQVPDDLVEALDGAASRRAAAAPPAHGEIVAMLRKAGARR